MDKIMFCHSEDDWMWASEDVNEAAQLFIDNLEQSEYNDLLDWPVCTLYRGVAKVPDISKFIDPEDIVTHMNESAADQYGEYAEDFMLDLDKSALDSLKDHIVEWAQQNDIRPEFFSVEDIKTFEYNVRDLL